MSSTEPMWYCYECEAEMRPLMVPDPHCASCNGTFVEKMENPQDDPREFSHAHPPGEEDFDEMQGLGVNPNFMLGLQSLLTSVRSPSAQHEVPGRPRSHSAGSRGMAGGFGGSSGGLRFEMTSGSGSHTRTWAFGGTNTLGGGDQPGNRPQGTADFMRRGVEPGSPRGDISGAMMAQYLMSLLGGGAARRSGTGGDPWAAILGPGFTGGAENGRWGDYAFSQEALDQIISEIMETSNSHRPVPAPDEVTAKLPREVLEEESPLLEKECAVCKEQFKLGTEDPDEQVVVSLPCKHPFHQPCILPWLKSSGTCPVCRFALVPQPDHPPTPGSSSGPANPASPQRTPGINSPVGGGILGTIMGMMRNGPSSETNNPSGTSDNGNGSSGDLNSSANTNTNTHDTSRRDANEREGSQHLPGGWNETVD